MQITRVIFDETCLKVFVHLKKKLLSAPIIIFTNWSKSFEVMCDASGVVLVVVWR